MDVSAISATTADSRLAALRIARAVERTDEMIRVNEWVNIILALLKAM
jgi:hypothetical protein